MIYLIVFLISIFFISLGLKSSKKLSKKILVFIGLLIPCVLAGLRNTTVGTDTGNYVLNLYKIAVNSVSFSSFVDISEKIYYSSDILYLLITYIFGKSQAPFQIVLFIYECLIIFPIYLSLKNSANKNQDILFGMLIFYFTFYNLSLNMVRQSIAISFFLLGFSYLKKGTISNYKLLSFLFLLIAIGFHDTALFGLLIYVLYLYFNSKAIKEKKKILVGIVLTFLCILGVVFYNPLLSFIGNSGIYPKALLYLNSFSTFDIDYLGTLVNLIIIIIMILNKNTCKSMNLNYKFGLLVSILNLLISFMGTFITYANRIAYYLYYIIIANYISLLCSNNLKKGNIYIKTILVFIIFLMYWIIVIYLNNSNETLPYIIYK